MRNPNEGVCAEPCIGESNRHEEGHESQSTDSLKLYFSNIRKYPLLKSEEEKKLARKIARGDLVARKKMIESNLRLVVNIAKRYTNRGFPLQDLIEEGNIGLIKSVERFKASKGCKFSTYATYWIRQSIERGIANQANSIRLPIHITSDMAKVARASRHLRMSLEREPTLDELAEKTGLSCRYLKKLDIINKKSYSLESYLPDGREQPLMESIEDKTFPAAAELIDMARRERQIRGWLDKLGDNEKIIIKLRFGLGKGAPQTLDDIGKSFGVTRERVRQIEVKALDELKKIISTSGDIASIDDL